MRFLVYSLCILAVLFGATAEDPPADPAAGGDKPTDGDGAAAGANDTAKDKGGANVTALIASCKGCVGDTCKDNLTVVKCSASKISDALKGNTDLATFWTTASKDKAEMEDIAKYDACVTLTLKDKGTEFRGCINEKLADGNETCKHILDNGAATCTACTKVDCNTEAAGATAIGHPPLIYYIISTVVSFKLLF